MKPKGIVRYITSNRDEVLKRLLKLYDVHRFGNMRFVIEDEDDESIVESGSNVDISETPPWIIQPADLITINNTQQQVLKKLPQLNVPQEKPEFSEDFLIYTSDCIICKVIVLIHSMLVAYNYYQIKNLPYPGFKPSSILNPEISPDLSDALLFAYYTLFADRYGNFMLRADLRSQLYAIMKIFFDVLYGWLPCDEVKRLREAYDTFHLTNCPIDTLEDFLHQLRAVSNRFAAEEPIWERQKANSTYTIPTPVIKNVEATTEIAGAKKRPRKNIPVKVAAHHFGVSDGTIHNWDHGLTTPPPEYPGRDVDEEIFIAQAKLYHARKHNEEQIKKNRAEGLTDKSIAPKSATGTDSTILLQRASIYKV